MDNHRSNPHYTTEWLTARFDLGESLEFLFFWGNKTHEEKPGKQCLSQWYESSFTVDDIKYNTAEHWMMARKALLFGDVATFEKIVMSANAKDAKELGRQVIGFDDIVWNSMRFDIVKTGNIHKFNQNPRLAKYLLSTGNSIIVEASPVDVIWGIGLAQDDSNIDNIYAWRGLNLLGFVLMEVRDFLKEFGHFSPPQDNMLPPWKKYPGIHPYDMFWSMGQGEDYVTKLYKWRSSLSERDQIIYDLINPTPHEWINQ